MGILFSINSIISFLNFGFNEIARGAEVSYNSLKLIFPKLLEKEIVIKTQKVGKADYYKFNLENQFVKNIIKIAWGLTKRDLNVDESNPKILVS